MKEYCVELNLVDHEEKLDGAAKVKKYITDKLEVPTTIDVYIVEKEITTY